MSRQPPRQILTASWRIALLTLAVAACGGGVFVQEATGESARQHAGAATDPAQRSSLADQRWRWPSAEQLTRVLLLRDYNTRVVMWGTFMLGACAGVVGVFMLLRKRSLMGDVVSHASLPGIALAFLLMEAAQAGSGKSLTGLLTGAFVAGILGIFATTAIRRLTRIKEDAAMAIVLSVFFGVGIALLTMIQGLATGSQAGLSQFIYGKAALMVSADVELIGWSSAVVLLLLFGLYKEFQLLCFDEKYAACQGWPVLWLDLLLMGLVVAVTVIGLQSVGLLLVVAMLIIPAAAARFWSDHLKWLLVAAGSIGAGSAYLGVLASALFPRLAAGAVIVLMGTSLFVASLLCGRRRGLLPRLALQWRMRRRVGKQHLLRAFFERLEESSPAVDRDPLAALPGQELSRRELLRSRSWLPRRLRAVLARAMREDLVRQTGPETFALTAEGAREAQRAVRNHRLWELYLIHFADIAPSHVDRDADQIEHLLEPAMLSELEAKLNAQYPSTTVPPSPHQRPGLHS